MPSRMVKASITPFGDQPVDARLHGRARNLRRGGEAGHGQARILPQQADELVVEIVHAPSILSI